MKKNVNVGRFVHSKKDVDVMKELNDNPKIRNLFIKFYNVMCRSCKAKHLSLMQRGFGIKEKDLCKVCKKRYEDIFK